MSQARWSMALHPSTWEVKEEGSRVQGQPRCLGSKRLDNLERILDTVPEIKMKQKSGDEGERAQLTMWTNGFSTLLFASGKTTESSDCPHGPVTTKTDLPLRIGHILCRAVWSSMCRFDLCLAVFLHCFSPGVPSQELREEIWHSELWRWLRG